MTILVKIKTGTVQPTTTDSEDGVTGHVHIKPTGPVRRYCAMQCKSADLPTPVLSFALMLACEFGIKSLFMCVYCIPSGKAVKKIAC